MTDLDEISETFEGIIIKAEKDVVVLCKQFVGSPIWQRSADQQYDYFGSIKIHGVAQIFTPQGKQYEMWNRFEKRIKFIVEDLSDNIVTESSYVDGGWNIARKGISVQMAIDRNPISESDYNRLNPGNQIIKKHFIYALDDHLHTLYSKPTTLNIYATYLNFKSNKVFVDVLID